jgi:hypothetical protein
LNFEVEEESTAAAPGEDNSDDCGPEDDGFKDSMSTSMLSSPESFDKT